MSYVVASWGNPASWKKAEYVLSSEVCLGEKVESFTSLDIIIEALRPDDVLLIVPDTLAAEPKMGVNILDKTDNYASILRNVIKRVSDDWIKKNTSSLAKNNYEVYVAANVGVYGDWSWEYAVRGGNPLMSYAAQVFIYVLKWLQDRINKKTNRNRIKLTIDLSHGINYMPLLVFRACRAACTCLSAANGVQFEIETYNSEPIPPKTGKPGNIPKLTIHRVESDTITPENAASQASRTLLAYSSKFVLLKASERPVKRVNIIRRRADSIRRNLIPANIILYNLPLAAVYYVVAGEDSFGDAVGLLTDALNLFMEETHIKREEKRIVHTISLEYDVAKAVAAAGALSEYVKRCVNESLQRELTGVEELMKYGVSLEELNEIVGRIGGEYEPVARNEINDIKRKCMKGEGGLDIGLGYWPFAEVKQPNIRNLITHAGLEKNITEGKITNGTVYLRYKKEGWEYARTLLNKNLKTKK